MGDYSYMKATKKKKYSYEKDLEYAAKHPRKKYSYEKDLERAAKKSIGKMGLIWIVAVLFVVIGAVGGFFAIKYAFKDDTFAMTAYQNGSIDIVIGEDEEFKKYEELGAKCISFGKNYSSDVTITYYYRADLSEAQVKVDKVDETKAGMYYAVYTTKASRYKSVTLIRNIYVTEVEK